MAERMSRFSRIVLIFLLGVVIALGALMVYALRTPVYQGRSVTRWLADLRQHWRPWHVASKTLMRRSGRP